MSKYLELTPEVLKAIGGGHADELVAEQPWLSMWNITAIGLGSIRCKRCLNLNWVCEIHPTKPWSGVVGDVLGCEPDCIGPGMLCIDRKGHQAMETP